jgi:hypothetical protein
MMLTTWLTAAVALGAASCVSAAEVVNERTVGVRGLVQGNNQEPCDDPVFCQWGKAGSVHVKRLFVDHPNIFWRCNEPGMIALTYDDG